MNLLITGAWREAGAYFDRLKDMGHEICFMQQEKDELPCTSDWVEGIICNGLFLYHDIAQFKNLSYVQLTSAGYDRVPMDYVRSHSIEIYNARGVYSIPMAEFALAGVLQLYKNSACFQKNQKQHVWNKCRDLQELFGKQVCIVGCGSVGTECAKRFKAFGCTVCGVDLYPRQDENYVAMSPLEGLEESLSSADIVVLTLPLTKETTHLMNDARFSILKEGAILVNIARGAVVDSRALLKAIPRLGGAVLDVFEEEPLQADSPLWEMKNIVITPHNSFVSDGNGVRLANLILENLRGKK